MRTIRPLLVVLVALTTTGCAALLDALRTVFQEPTFTFKSVTLTGVTLGGLTLDTTWQLSNPNTVGLSLASVDYALFIDGKQVVAGAPPMGLQVPAQGSTELHFPANIKFTDLVTVLDTFLTKDTAHWRAEGSLGVETPVGVLALPLAYEADFEVPKLPQVQFQDPRVSNLSFAGATFEFPLVVTNRNTYALPVSSLTGALSLGGAPLGTVSTGDLGVLAGKGARTVAVPVTVSFLSAASAVVRAAQGGSAQVTFDAQLQSGPQAVPLKLEQLVNFVR